MKLFSKKKDEAKEHFNWIKKWPVYLIISASILLVGIVSLTSWGFKLGVEFTGGITAEYRFKNEQIVEELSSSLEKSGLKPESIQKSADKTYLIKFGSEIDTKGKDIKTTLSEVTGKEAELLSFEQIGPSVSKELIIKTLFAILLSAGAILAWIAYQFKEVKFGIAATIATFHDALVILGLFALFGHLFGAQVDFLFITALLTILSFSVHDTIIVYDRIREIRKKHGGAIHEVANRAISETMRRSVFNSLSVIIMLAALVFLGGPSTRWFAVALLVGTISGTYSSPFVAVPLLVLLTRKRKSS